jgi:sensor histidine kinase YesM
VNKKKAYRLIQSIGWALYAIIIIGGVFVFSSDFQLIMAVPILVEAAFFFAITHYFRSLNKKWGWLHLSAIQLMPKMLASILLMAVPIYFIRVFVSYVLDIYSPNLLSIVNIIGNVIGNYFVLFIWTSLYYAFHYFERYNLSLKYEVANNRMELDRLKSQLNPHFIFNALNSIRALVDEDPSRSKIAINHLSNILRSSLSADKKELILFKDEMETVEAYLAMETIRFEERLNSNVEISPETTTVLVPPLMLQTLVENGIKHGISKLKKGGVLSVKAFIDQKYLNVEIRNSGQLNPKVIEEGGYGIKNTIQRLKIIYKNKAEFNIRNESKNIVLTLVRIPTKY